MSQAGVTDNKENARDGQAPNVVLKQKEIFEAISRLKQQVLDVSATTEEAKVRTTALEQQQASQEHRFNESASGAATTLQETDHKMTEASKHLEDQTASISSQTQALDSALQVLEQNKHGQVASPSTTDSKVLSMVPELSTSSDVVSDPHKPNSIWAKIVHELRRGLFIVRDAYLHHPTYGSIIAIVVIVFWIRYTRRR